MILSLLFFGSSHSNSRVVSTILGPRRWGFTRGQIEKPFVEVLEVESTARRRIRGYG